MLTMQSIKRMAGLAVVAVGSLVAPALAHHSFAMYDQTKTVTLTGVATRFIAQANHAELHLIVIGPDGKLLKDTDGKNVEYGVEMAGAAAMAQQGVTAESFPAGTIFSVKVNPMRDGSNFGSRVGGTAIAKCPWKVPPAPGSTCDTVAGSQLIGGSAF
jgi:hypothetical protein